MADIFDEVRRVLRNDGTLWLNYGDSYASSVNGTSANDTKLKGNDDRTFRDKPFSTVGPIAGPGYRTPFRTGKAYLDHRHPQPPAGGVLKPKDMCGVPWRVAFALQERGWYLRQDIIWAKPNPMPESIRDRCTKAHEYLFLLAKSERYYFDQEAIAEPAVHAGETRTTSVDASFAGQAAGRGITPSGNAIPGSVMTIGANRNRRSVWTIATAPFSEAHFATFPPELPELCIKAGTSQKGYCSACRKPWVRQVEMTAEYKAMLDSGKAWRGNEGNPQPGVNRQPKGHPSQVPQKYNTLGWAPSCSCNAGIVRATVLDPFGGAGTTGLVADRLQRHAILIELNPDYAAMARARIDGDRGGLLDLMEAAQ